MLVFTFYLIILTFYPMCGLAEIWTVLHVITNLIYSSLVRPVPDFAGKRPQSHIVTGCITVIPFTF